MSTAAGACTRRPREIRKNGRRSKLAGRTSAVMTHCAGPDAVLSTRYCWIWPWTSPRVWNAFSAPNARPRSCVACSTTPFGPRRIEAAAAVRPVKVKWSCTITCRTWTSAAANARCVMTMTMQLQRSTSPRDFVLPTLRTPNRSSDVIYVMCTPVRRPCADKSNGFFFFFYFYSVIVKFLPCGVHRMTDKRVRLRIICKLRFLNENIIPIITQYDYNTTLSMLYS